MIDDIRFNLLDVAVANFQVFSHSDHTAHKSGSNDNQVIYSSENCNEYVLNRWDHPVQADVGYIWLDQLVRGQSLLYGL